MYRRRSLKGWDQPAQVMSNSVGYLGGKDVTFVSGVRSPTVRRELGALLRKLRTGKGLTVEQAAGRLLFSMSKLRRMETGHGVATSRDIRDLCDLYDVTHEAEREHMMKLAAEGKQQAWWQSYDLKLLQTADYSRTGHEAPMRRLSPDQIELQIGAKLTRQRILRQERPPASASCSTGRHCTRWRPGARSWQPSWPRSWTYRPCRTQRSRCFRLNWALPLP
jgi:transcriptional regulator with XRE-family HTH domain